MTIFKSKFLFFLLAAFALHACVESSEEQTEATEEAPTAQEANGSDGSSIVSVGTEIFSIPSPVQTALLIESAGAEYDASLPNAPENLENYVSEFDRGLVLGAYGIDLAYTSIFGMNQQSIGYLNAVEKLANELDMANAIDKSTIKRFSKNISERDSLLALSTTFFRQSDLYLKENQREDVAALILVGGWAEGMYLAYNSAQGNASIRQRIAEQKLTLDNLVGLLESLESTEQMDELLTELKAVQAHFTNVKVTYEYQRPEEKPEEKLTVLKSKTTYEMSEAQLDSIGMSIETLRNNIVG